MVAKPKFLPPAAVESELLRTAKAKDDAEAALQARPHPLGKQSQRRGTATPWWRCERLGGRGAACLTLDLMRAGCHPCAEGSAERFQGGAEPPGRISRPDGQRGRCAPRLGAGPAP